MQSSLFINWWKLYWIFKTTTSDPGYTFAKTLVDSSRIFNGQIITKPDKNLSWANMKLWEWDEHKLKRQILKIMPQNLNLE